MRMGRVHAGLASLVKDVLGTARVPVLVMGAVWRISVNAMLVGLEMIAISQKFKIHVKTVQESASETSASVPLTVKSVTKTLTAKMFPVKMMLASSNKRIAHAERLVTLMKQ